MNKTNKAEKRPVIALLGRPNVGKSTLFNRLTGTKNALVDKTPGLTRDRRYAVLDLEGSQVEIIDTAGMAVSENRNVLTSRVQEQTAKAIDQADCLCVMFDAESGLQPGDIEIVELVRKSFKPWIAVINKVESTRTQAAALEFYETGIPEFTTISAKNGRGIEKLRSSLSHACKAAGSGKAAVGNTAQAEGSSMRVCLIGRPNVGKSSLLNRFMGQERMIVSDIPGTTLDSIDCLVEREGLTDIIFVDTAGIRKRARVRKRVEKFSVLKAMESIRTSDICILLFDVTEGITEQDRRLAGYTRDYSKGCITVFNKWDLVREDRKLRKVLNQEAKFLGKMLPYAPHLNISAATGKNIKRIFPLIDEVYRDYTFRESTGRLNRILKQALLRKNPPVTKGHFLKIYYVTQTGTRPPVLTFFANYPRLFPEHYRRFLENFFRQELNIPNTPIKIVLRER